jgi:hypothetical protein
MQLSRSFIIALLIVIAMAFGTGSASATVYSGSIVDGADGHYLGKYPATDVITESMSIDNATGKWRTVITFRGKALTTTNVQIYIAFDTGALNEFGWPDRVPYYEIAVRGGKMTFVDRTVAGFGRFGGEPKVTLSRPGKVLVAEVVSPGMIGVVPLKASPMRLSYKTVNQDLVLGFPLLPQP